MTIKGKIKQKLSRGKAGRATGAIESFHSKVHPMKKERLIAGAKARVKARKV